MSARPNHQQNSSPRDGTSCQFSKKYGENVVFITINNVQLVLKISESEVNHC